MTIRFCIRPKVIRTHITNDIQSVDNKELYSEGVKRQVLTLHTKQNEVDLLTEDNSKIIVGRYPTPYKLTKAGSLLYREYIIYIKKDDLDIPPSSDFFIASLTNIENNFICML
jgi:hypothetical protein